jgi:radical SAM protein with 4Fe4S-binding SPASM domain
MDLIIKPTELCNFKCTFCSSTKIAHHKKDLLDHNYIFRFLKRFPQTKTIIVNGGDPLMVEPDYYWRIIDWLDEHNYDTSISLTTNLWPFYKKPKKWTPLFNNDRIGVTTSFQYGGGRLKGDFTEFTEEDFWKCSDTMLEYCGYRPDFIAVVVPENEDMALKNVELAYKMSDGKEPKDTFENLSKEKKGVECKLNYAMSSGDQDKPYLLSKIYQKYVEIYERGLYPWEFNTRQMMKRIRGEITLCPQNRKCDEGIRSFNPSGDYYSCGAFGDDKDKAIDFEAEMQGEFFTPLQKDVNLFSMKRACLECPMFNICNGCRKTIKDFKKHNVVEEHCKLMKTIAPKILKANGLNIKVTPYVDERNVG